MLQPPFENIEDLHEYVFQILLKLHEEDNSFMFTLREPHQFISGKEQYWFYENDNQSLLFSCWQDISTIMNKPTIYFVVDISGEISLRYGNAEKQLLNISKSIHYEINTSPSKYPGFWAIKLGKEINTFLLKEVKNRIDSIIVRQENIGDFLISIPYNEFKRRLDNIQKRRGQISSIDFSQIKLRQMVLSNLFLKNTGHFSTLNIEFHKRITCIFGGNGSGKSTILRAIGSILLGEDVLMEKNQKKVENF
jgi:hypothetical protein